MESRFMRPPPSRWRFRSTAPSRRSWRPSVHVVGRFARLRRVVYHVRRACATDSRLRLIRAPYAACRRLFKRSPGKLYKWARSARTCCARTEEGKREEGEGKREEGRGKREHGRGNREEGKGERECGFRISDCGMGRRGKVQTSRIHRPVGAGADRESRFDRLTAGGARTTVRQAHRRRRS